MEDWVKSINKMIKMSRSNGGMLSVSDIVSSEY